MQRGAQAQTLQASRRPALVQVYHQRHGQLWPLQVAAKVDEGVKQLVRAEKSQKQSRLVLCIMLLGVAVIVMTVVVVFKKLLFG